MIIRSLPALVILALGALCCSAASKPAPEIWMNHHHPEELVKPGAKCEFVLKHLDVLEFPINIVAFRIKKDDLQRLVDVCKKNRIKLAFEGGYFDSYNESIDFSAPNPKGITDKVRASLSDTIGEETARTEIAKMKLLADCGGTLDYINMDGPVRRLLYPGCDMGRWDTKGMGSIDECVDQMIAYMRAWRNVYPNVQFFALTNFPNWGWKNDINYWGTGPNSFKWGNYHVVLHKIVSRTKAAGIPVLGITADNPYNYYLGTHPRPAGSIPPPPQDWPGRLLDLEWETKALGLEFNLIANSEIGGMTSGEAFCSGSLEFIDRYLRDGGSPRRIILQSWYPHPTEVVPEDKPGTMTYLVKKVIQRLK